MKTHVDVPLPDYYGQGGRLGKPAARELVDSAYAHDCSQAPILLEGISYADMAHAMMLIRQGVIPAAEGAVLMRGLVELHEHQSGLVMDPSFGDVYNNREAALKKMIGSTAGWLHAGRPRREAVNIGYLLHLRADLIDLLRGLIALGEVLAAQAARHAATLMPDQTYLHHAHPTSLGHYLLTYLSPMFRDLDRLKTGYLHVDMCPAGSGSVNGSRLPIDRNMLRESLGFHDMAVHTRDAMWQPDVPIEIISAVVAMMVNVNRFSEELQLWSTLEYGMVDLPDEFCRASVIMPQKKNPYPMTYIRGLTGFLLGLTASFAAVGKTYSGNPDSRTFVYAELPEAVGKSAAALRLFAGIVGKLAPNAERMLDLVRAGYANATDLADVIMTRFGYDYRTAHQIIGRTVRTAIAAGIPGSKIDAIMVRAAAREITGTEPDITEADVTPATDPAAIVASRKSIGGASQERMAEMLAASTAKLQAAHDWVEEAGERNASALAQLLEQARVMAGLQ